MLRKIININDNLCNGCGVCIPNCPEGSLQMIDGKARLVSELSCDGLGACIGECPVGAISIVEREAEAYDELTVIKNIAKAGANTIKAHLSHLNAHNESTYLKIALTYLEQNNISIPDYKEQKHHEGCPGTKIMDNTSKKTETEINSNVRLNSELRQWPIQLSLLNPNASFFKHAELLIAADCVPFAYANFHQKFLKNKVMINFCPKLDSNINEYIEKLSEILKNNDIKNITVLRMEVPCCSGTTKILEAALKNSNKNILVKEYVISLDGNLI